MKFGYCFSARRLKMISSLFILFFIAGSMMSIVKAQIPNTLNYQGVLTATDAKPVADGSYQLTFKLYNAATGSTALWSEAQNVTTSNGVFSVVLGKVSPLKNIPFDEPYWLGITVSNGTEMTPRIQLSASAYSLRARSVADSSISGAGIAAGQVIRNVNGITDSVTIEAGSNVSIQKSAHKLTISSTGSGSSPWSPDNNDIAYTAGNVGIGAYTGGSARLLVASQSNITTPQLRLHETSSGYSRLNFDNGSGAGNFWAIAGLTATTRTAERLNFYNYQTGDIMSITGDGRVGIGVGATAQKPNTLLTVQSHHSYAGYFSSDSTDKGVGLHADDTMLGGTGVEGVGSQVGVSGETSGSNGLANGWSAGIEGAASATGNNVNYGVYGYAVNASTNYAVYAEGDLAYTGSLIHASDAKFKENVRPINQVLSKVMELAPKSYTFRKDPSYKTMNFSPGEQYGVIAQDIEKVFPDLVVDAVDLGRDPNNPKAPAKPIHYKGVKYLQMIPILLEAVKEQQQEIQKQQKLIDDLTAEVERLKK